MNRRLTHLFVMLPVVMCLFQHDMLFGAASASGNHSLLGGGYSRGSDGVVTDRATVVLYGKIQQNLTLTEEIKKMEVDVAKLNAQWEALPDARKKDSEDREAQSLKNDLDQAEDILAQTRRRKKMLFSPNNAGKIIARGFAGKDDFDMLDDDITGVKDGLIQGLTISTSRAVAGVLEQRIKGSCEVVLGGAWDKMFGWLVDSWEAFCLLLFHEDKKPFQPEVLEGWLDFIESTLNDIERMVKDGLKDSLRGYDMTRRKFDLDATDDAENNAATQEVQENVWIELVFGYADQFERIALEIATRREFYEEDSLESFYATQIIKRLLDFKELLVTSKSLNDLDAQLHSNKAIIAATKTNLKNLFKRLVVKVTPRTYSLKKGSDSLSELSFNRNKEGEGGYRRGRSMDDDYPGGMWS